PPSRDLLSFPTRRSSDLGGSHEATNLRIHLDVQREVFERQGIDVAQEEFLHRCAEFFRSLSIGSAPQVGVISTCTARSAKYALRSEEHTSELQSRENLVC